MKALILATAMAVGLAGYAGAVEVKKNTKAPVIVGKVMTDADMDKVTAGNAEQAAVICCNYPGPYTWGNSRSYNATLPSQATTNGFRGGF